jgi:hypothetical protein
VEIGGDAEWEVCSEEADEDSPEEMEVALLTPNSFVARRWLDGFDP